MNGKDAPANIHIWPGFVKVPLLVDLSPTHDSLVVCHDSRLGAGWGHMFDTLHPKLCCTFIHSHVFGATTGRMSLNAPDVFGMPFYWHDHEWPLVILPWSRKGIVLYVAGFDEVLTECYNLNATFEETINDCNKISLCCVWCFFVHLRAS